MASRAGAKHPRPPRQHLRDTGDHGDHGAALFCAGADRHGPRRNRRGNKHNCMACATVIRSPKPAIETAHLRCPGENFITCRSIVCSAAPTGARLNWSAAWAWISAPKPSAPERSAVEARRLSPASSSRSVRRILQKDIDRVRAVREAVGDEASIRVDGNASLFIRRRPRGIECALSCYHLSDAEQPLARGDLKSLAELRRAVGVPIAAQESVTSPEDALAVLEARRRRSVENKAHAISAAFKRALQVAAMVGAKGLPVVIGQGSACTPILSAAEMHLHAAIEKRPTGRRNDRLPTSRRARYF